MAGEITDDIIENACDDMRMAMQDLLENGPNEYDYGRVISARRSIGTLADMLMPDDNSAPN